MNTTNDISSTPKQIKRLGLRRSSSISKDKSAKKPIETCDNSKINESDTPVSQAKRRRVPQSDVKINYKNLEKNCDIQSLNTPATPRNSSSFTNVERAAVSTNCRPYRLALSKRIREKMTKKRLEFYLANELQKEEEEEEGEEKTEEQYTSSSEINLPNSKEDLLKQIEMSRKELHDRQEHIKKVQNLQEAINVWKTGFSLAVQDLQQKIDPHLETSVILQHLHIPPEMIKYIDE